MLAKYDLRLPDINANKSNGVYRLPLDEFIDYKKMGMKPILSNTTVVKESQSCLKLKLDDLTRIESILANNPNRDIVEDRKQKESFSIKDVSNVLARTKMVLFYVEWFLEVDTWIHQF